MCRDRFSMPGPSETLDIPAGPNFMRLYSLAWCCEASLPSFEKGQVVGVCCAARQRICSHLCNERVVCLCVIWTRCSTPVIRALGVLQNGPWDHPRNCRRAKGSTRVENGGRHRRVRGGMGGGGERQEPSLTCWICKGGGWRTRSVDG